MIQRSTSRDAGPRPAGWAMESRGQADPATDSAMTTVRDQSRTVSLKHVNRVRFNLMCQK